MRNIYILILIVLFNCYLINLAEAKSILFNHNNSSVQLLDKLTKDGQEVRKNDKPFEKVDTSTDTERSAKLRYKFNSEKYFFFPENPYNKGKSPIE